MTKALLFKWLPVVLIATAGMLSSCRNTASDVEQAPPAAYAAPVVQPLTLDKAVKLNWDTIKGIAVHPVVRPFDLDRLPARAYDTAGFKPFKFPVKEARFDFRSAQATYLDVDKLPARPLKFTTEKLPPPRLIHSGLPHLKNLAQSVFELTAAQGLPGSFINSLFIDRDGFLWIASGIGLYRYDGENLLFYMPVIQPHYIWSMVQDSTGRIWLGTLNNGDLEVLDPANLTLKKADRSSGLNVADVTSLYQDEQQRIWVASSTGTSIIDPAKQTIKRLGKRNGLSDTTAFRIMPDNDRHIWIATDKGLDVIDLEAKKIRYLTSSNDFKLNGIFNMTFDRSGRLWLGYQSGAINVLDLKKNTMQTISELQPMQKTILSLMEDRHGIMWAATNGNGVAIINSKNWTARSVTKSSGLNNDNANNIILDKQGQVWIATDGGLNMVKRDDAVVNRIGNTQVLNLAGDSQGLIWQYTNNLNGVDIFNLKNKTIRHLGARQGLASDTTGIATEINGKIFISTPAALDIINPKAKTITHIRTEQGTRKQLEYYATADNKGRIWITETGGFCVYDASLNIVKHIGQAQGLNSNSVHTMQADARGRIWFTTDQGLTFIDPDKDLIQNITNNAQGLRDFNQGPCFLDDKHGNMWIGTDKGVYIANLQNRTLTTFSTPQGLIDERIATLLLHGHQIYASTVSGLTIISPPAEGIVPKKKWGTQSFGKNYGYQKLSPGYGSTDVITPNGVLVSGDYGLTVSDLPKRNLFSALTFITGITIMDEPKLFNGRGPAVLNHLKWNSVGGPYNLPVGFQLPHDQNYLRFNYLSLNLVDHDATWYRYKLIGSDTGWSAPTTTTQSRNYFNLPPGSYTFEVVSNNPDAGNNGDSWGKPAVFSFSVRPPWWQSWWAYVIYTLLATGAVWGLVAFRSMQLVKEKRILEHKVQVRTEEVMQQKEEIEAQRDSLEIQRVDLENAFGRLKATQNQLIQAEKMASLGELTAGIAHEIQNPLNFVNNFSDVSKELMEEFREELDKGNIDAVKLISAEVMENLDKINRHGRRADNIVKGMLEHSRKSTGVKEPDDINKLADEYMRLSYHGLRAKDKSFNASLLTHFDEDLPKVNMVPQDIGRVLLNLFNNSFYAVSQKAKNAGPGYKPEVSVSTSTQNGQVIISLKDNGTGIPDAIKDKILQPFFTTKPTGEGTGLGLSLSYDILVKGHNGTLEINSKEGEGAEFIVKLPVD